MCKYRKVFFVAEKCNTCKHRKKCQKIVIMDIIRKLAIPAVVLAVLIYAFIMVGAAMAGSSVEVSVVPNESCYSKPEEIVTVIEIANYEDTEKQDVVLEDGTESSPEESSNDRFTDEEKLAMGKVVWKESRGEPFDGKVAVAAVAINRLETKDPLFGASNGSMMEVLTYPGAFSSISGFYDWDFQNTPEYEECMRAVEEAVSGNDPTKEHFEEGALFFYSTIIPLSEAEAARREGIDIYQIGNHAFHREMN